MSTKIGHFEILSELARSATGVVYKADDPQTGQTVALKAIQLSAFGEHSAELGECLLEEVERTRALSHPNLAPLSSAAEIEGQFCAAMEYIQGNSVATMLARKEGFSIWDLLDIGRQVCSGLDYAHSQNAFHYSLEPGKIMCGWDGTVRVLCIGVSSVGKFVAQMPDVPLVLHYLSPEQVRGENIDARSNLFSLGAVFYEMVTDRKAFDGADAESLRQSILESIPEAPIQVNPKLHPQLSDLILKALAKDPGERYQSGRELLDDLEKCKESKPAAKKAAPPVKAAVPPPPVKAAAPTRLPSGPPKPSANPLSEKQPAEKRPAEKRPAAPAWPATTSPSAVEAHAASPEPVKTRKVAAAAAGWGNIEAASQPPSASMSFSAVDQPAVEAPIAEPPRFTVDPAMAENGPAGGGTSVSFSEMTELPPLKEVYTAPPPPPPPQEFEQEASPTPSFKAREPVKPRIQPREVAGKAIKEIKGVPPRLMIYAVAGAVVLILIIAGALFFHYSGSNSDGDSARSAAAEAATQAAANQAAARAAQSQPAEPDVAAQAEPAEPSETGAATAPVAAPSRGKNPRKKAPAPVAVVVPGQMSIDSTPQGAQVQLDGKSDPSWITPFTLAGVSAGPHAITVSKAGYTSDTRTVDVASGSKSFVVSHLAQLMATLAVTSNPAGANVYIDGKDSGKLTPAQVSVDKGQHVVLVRKPGYIDETTSAQFVLNQTVSFSPSLRPLGNVDDIRTTGKMKRLFGGKEAAGMGTISIKTQPKGAQVAVNQHVLDKLAPIDFLLDPGNYLVDITLTGYVPIHKIITVDRGGKTVIDDAMQHE
jgi:serine/threonine-protein kinase